MDEQDGHNWQKEVATGEVLMSLRLDSNEYT